MSELEEGTAIGGFVVRREIGRGAMGVVYLAEQTSIGRLVALKVLREEVSHDAQFRERFQREASILGRLHTPHVVQIYDYGDSAGRLFIATQYVQGGDLESQLSPAQPFNVMHALAIVRQLCLAVAEAHRVGVVHRDIKPSNVLLHSGADPFAYLSDFGIARTLDAGETSLFATAGTPGYMAPERFEGAPATPSGDIYSLGCLLVALITGAPPYGGATDLVVMSQHLGAPVPQLETGTTIATGVNDVLGRSMAKDPQDRFESVDEMVSAIDFVQQRQPQATPTPGLLSSPTVAAVPGLRRAQQVARSRMNSGSGTGDVEGIGPDRSAPVASRGPSKRNGKLILVLLMVGAAVAATGWLNSSGGKQTTQGAEEPKGSAASGSAEKSGGGSETAPKDCQDGMYCLAEPSGYDEALSGDFDGNKEPDFAVIAQDAAGHWGVSATYGRQSGSRTRWTRIGDWNPRRDKSLSADFTGDKMTDIVLVRSRKGILVADLLAGRNGSALGEPRRWARLGSVRALGPIGAGQFTDGQSADLVTVTRDGAVIVYRSLLDRAAPGESWGATPRRGIGSAVLLGRNFAGGRFAGLAIVRPDRGSWNVEVMPSTGYSFGPPEGWGTYRGEGRAFLARDVNGDTRADLVALGGSSIDVMLANSSRGFAEATPWVGLKNAAVWPRLYSGDFDDDDRHLMDLAVMSTRPDGSVRVTPQTSTGTELAQQRERSVATWQVSPQ